MCDEYNALLRNKTWHLVEETKEKNYYRLQMGFQDQEEI